MSRNERDPSETDERDSSEADERDTPETDERDTPEADEYADWSLPGRGDEYTESSAGDGSDDDWKAPPEMREPLLRDRIRDRLGVTPQRWYVVETFLLVLPYPLFVAVYFLFDVDETLFLAGTLAYSLAATYIGFLS